MDRELDLADNKGEKPEDIEASQEVRLKSVLSKLNSLKDRINKLKATYSKDSDEDFEIYADDGSLIEEESEIIVVNKEADETSAIQEKAESETGVERISPDEIEDGAEPACADETIEVEDEEPEEKETEPVDEPADAGEEEIDDGQDFLTPEEMMARKMGASNVEKIEPASIEEKPFNEDDIFLTPDEMIARSHPMSVDKKEHDSAPDKADDVKTRAPRPRFKVDIAQDIDEIVSRIFKPVDKEKDKVQFISPDELYKEKKEQEERRRKQVSFKPSLFDIDSMVSMALEEEKSRLLGDAKEESKEEAPVLDKIKQISLFELEESEEEETEKEEFKQLDLKPILKKKDIDSPVDLISPDEMQEEEDFVSHALDMGTMLKDRFKILKVVNEKRDRNTYLVKDVRVSGEKYILKEVLLKPMSKEELKDRRDKFRDTIRIISTFKHPNLSIVYEGFSENGREYSYMERIDGLDLKKIAGMSAKGFSEKEIIEWGSQLCEAVEFMHFRPKPFTLGELMPHHIMFDHSGKIKLTGYDLQRFFDVNRTLAFMPDDPTKLYEDVTKVARIIYFLITRQIYQEEFDIKWPYNIKPKMRKLLETAVKTEQKTYGDIRQFHKDLLDTQVEEEEPVSILQKIYNFPKIKIDFFFIEKGTKAFLNQHPFMLALESLFVVFLAFLWLTNPFEPRAYTRTPGKPVSYIASSNSIFTVDPKDYRILDEKRVGIQPRAMVSLRSKFERKDIEHRGEYVEKQVLLLSNVFGSKVFVLDVKDNTILKTINTGQNPFAFLIDKKRKTVRILHMSLPMILLLEENTLRPRRLELIEDDPTFAIYVPGKIKKIEKNEWIKTKSKRVRVFSHKDNQMRGVVIAMKEEKTLLALNPENGELIGKLELDFEPDGLLLQKDTQEIYILDRKNERIVPYRLIRRRLGSPLYMPRIGRDPVYMMNANGYGRIWIACHDSNNVMVYNPVLGRFENDRVNTMLHCGGVRPINMAYRAKSGEMWISCAGTKDVRVFDYKTKKLKKTIQLGKAPYSVTFID